MKIDAFLYWSNLALYEDCPQQFLWKSGWNTIDLGRGPGRGKEKPVKKSEHHAIMGVAIQKAVEVFYSEALYTKIHAFSDLKDKLLQIGEDEFQNELRKRFIDWRGPRVPTQDEMRTIIQEGILGYLRTLKAHRLVGTWNAAELDLRANLDPANPIGGRPDVVIRRDDTGLTVLDGKNSNRFKDPHDKSRFMTFTDPDQLRWYALLWHLVHGKVPDRLGFVFYRFPYGNPVLGVDGQEKPGQIEPGVEWVSFTKADLKGLAQRAVDVRKGMIAEKFEARPEPSKCRMCDYETVCPERQAQKASNKRGPRSTTSLFEGTTGLVSLGFGNSTSPVKG